MFVNTLERLERNYKYFARKDSVENGMYLTPKDEYLVEVEEADRRGFCAEEFLTSSLLLDRFALLGPKESLCWLYAPVETELKVVRRMAMADETKKRFTLGI